MFIIFGLNNRQRITGEGEFLCPHCAQSRRYERVESRHYVSLYFVPLLPVSPPETFIRCTVCDHAYLPSILSTPLPAKPKRAPGLAEQINSLKARIEAGEAVDVVLNDLTRAGLDFEVAQGMVSPYIQPERGVCTSCGLNYAPHVRSCAECGGDVIRKRA